MYSKTLSLFFLFFINGLFAFAQRPPEEFFKGLDNMKTNKAQAKTDLLAAVSKDPAFHGSYHFLGVLYFENQQLDSAIYCFKKAVDLNQANVNHTREMAYARLIDMYTYKHDFDNGFKVAREAYNLYPDNANIESNLRDLCLWAFYIKHTGFDAAYLSPDTKSEYLVTSIPQEYLVTRKIYIDGERVEVVSQALSIANKSAYDILKCVPYGKDKAGAKELRFKLGWDMNKEFGGKPMPTAEVIANKTNPVYERLGAALAGEDKVDLKAKIEEMLKQ